MVKEKKVYITSDGKEYKTEKCALRQENILLMEGKGLKKEEVDRWVEEIKHSNRTTKLLADRHETWQDWQTYHLEDLFKIINKRKKNVYQYYLLEEHDWRDEYKIVYKEEMIELPDNDMPESFKKYVEQLNEDSSDGSIYSLIFLDVYEDVKRYLIKKKELTIEEKLEKGISLTEREIQDMRWDFAEVYEVEGDEGRWMRHMTTVVKVGNGDLYAINWDRGLTESQENTFCNQPQKVRLKEKEVTTIITEIVYIDE